MGIIDRDGALMTVIGGDSREFVAAIDSAVKAVDELESQLAEANNKVREAKEEMDKAANAAQKVGQKIDEQREKMLPVKEAMKALAEEYKRLKEIGDKAGAAVIKTKLSEMKEAYKEQAEVLKKLTAEQKQAAERAKDLRSEYNSLDVEARKVTRSLNSTKDALHNTISKAKDGVEGMASSFAGGLMGIGSKLAVGFGLSEFANKVIEVRSEMQMLETSFGVLLNGRNVEQFLSQMKAFAVESPLSLGGISSAAQTLLGFGVDAEKVLPTLRQLADVSMGNEERFKSLALAFAQVQSAGKLMGQDLLQMINAGFNPLQEISRQTGESVAVLREKMSEGGISAEMVANAFRVATQEGGQFYGMTKKQAEGLAGLKAQLDGAIENAFNEIGKSQEGIIAGGYKLATGLVENYETLGKVLTTLIAVYGTYKAAVIAANVVDQVRKVTTAQTIIAETGATIVKRGLTLEILKQTAAQLGLNAAVLANPYVLVAMAVVGLTVAIVAWTDATDAAQVATEALNREAEEAAQKADEERAELERLVAVIKDETATREEKTRALETLKRLFPTIFSNLDIETAKYIDLAKAMKEANQQREIRNQLEGEEKLKKAEELLKYGSKDGVHFSHAAKELLGIENGFWASMWGPDNVELYNALWEYVRQGREKQRKEALARQEAAYAEMSKEDKLRHNNAQIASLKAKMKNREEELSKNDSTSKLTGVKFNTKRDPLIDSYRKQISDLEEKNKQITAPVDKEQTWQHQKKQAEEASRKAKEKLEKLKKDANATVAEVRKAQEEAEQAEKTAKSFSGGQSDKKSQGKGNQQRATEQALRNAEAERKDKDRLSQMEAKKKRDAERLAEDTRNAITQMEIDGMNEGMEKLLKQRSLNAKKELLALKREKEDYIEMQVAFERQKHEMQENMNARGNNEYQKKDFDEQTARSGVDTSLLDSKIKQWRATQIANDVAFAKEREEQEAKSWNEYYLKYGTYQERRKALIDKYAQEIADAEKKGEEARRAMLEKERDTQLDEFDNQLFNSATLMGQLFADTSKKSVAEIQLIIDKVRMLMEYLSAVKNEEGAAQVGGKTVGRTEIMSLVGVSSNTMEDLERSPEKVKAITDRLAELLNTVKERGNPIQVAFADIAEGVELINKGGKDEAGSSNTLKGIGKIGAATKALIPHLQGAAAALSQIFDSGDEDGGSLADELNTAIGLLGDMASIAEGIGSGNPMAVIQGVSGLFQKANEAAKRHREALDKLHAQRTAQQREYNLLLLKQNLEFERAKTIFGDNSFGRAMNAVRVMKDAYSQLNKEVKGTVEQREKLSKGLFGIPRKLSYAETNYAGIASIKVKTGHEKTGLFGWGKGRDVYSSLLTVYPKLIKANGELDETLAETILKTKDLDEAGKTSLEAMLTLSKQGREAWEQTREYLSGIFGDLGAQISSALTDAFRNGTDAAEVFSRSVGKMLNNLAQQMIYNATLGPLIEKAQGQFEEVAKNDKLTDEQKFEQWSEILNNLTTDAIAQRENYNRLMTKYGEIAQSKGIDIHKGEGTSDKQEASRKAFEAVSQDTVDELNGRVTGILYSQIRTEEYFERVLSILQFSHNELVLLKNYGLITAEGITEMKQSVSYCLDNLHKIAKNTDELHTIREIMERVKKNTDRL